jgi:hypothetical protein
MRGKLVGMVGFEPTTLYVQNIRSNSFNQHSFYRGKILKERLISTAELHPHFFFARVAGYDPTTIVLETIMLPITPHSCICGLGQ